MCIEISLVTFPYHPRKDIVWIPSFQYLPETIHKREDGPLPRQGSLNGKGSTDPLCP